MCQFEPDGGQDRSQIFKNNFSNKLTCYKLRTTQKMSNLLPYCPRLHCRLKFVAVQIRNILTMHFLNCFLELEQFYERNPFWRYRRQRGKNREVTIRTASSLILWDMTRDGETPYFKKCQGFCLQGARPDMQFS